MKKRIVYKISVCIISVLVFVGCNGNLQREPLTKVYSFAESDHGFTGDFADLPPDYKEEDIYELLFDYVDRPAELGSGKALRMEGHNRSDDLFMFVKKRLTKADGLQPNTTYRIILEVDLASNAPAGAVGIGGPPGEAVYVKVGAAAIEPVPQISSGDDWLRLNLDKGNQSGGGSNGVVVGDVAKPSNEDFETFEMKTLKNDGHPLEITTDSQGNLWIFVGTDSGFEGKTTIYYTQIKITLREK